VIPIPIRGRGLVLVLVAFLTGCYRLSVGPALEGERRARVLEAFFRLADTAGACASFDADVTATAPHWFGRQVFSGFVVGRAPAYGKLVILSPLGQPLALFATDGRTFQYLDTGRRRAWTGRIASLATTEGAGVDTAHLYDVLTGRPVACGADAGGVTVLSEAGGDRYLIGYRCGNGGVWHEYRFDRRAGTILEYRQRPDSGGEPVIVVTYEEYADISGQRGANDAGCRLPSRLRISTERGTVEITLHDIMVGQPYGPAEFRLAVPADYQINRIP